MIESETRRADPSRAGGGILLELGKGQIRASEAVPSGGNWPRVSGSPSLATPSGGREKGGRAEKTICELAPLERAKAPLPVPAPNSRQLRPRLLLTANVTAGTSVLPRSRCSYTGNRGNSWVETWWCVGCSGVYPEEEKSPQMF